MVGMTDWQPTATMSSLRKRSELASKVRTFLQQAGCLEVETPLLADGCAGHPEQRPIRVDEETLPWNLYLQGSPEAGMKRLVAAGSGDIFQLSKAFRADAVDKNHNPEFTILEWYRVGWPYEQLMSEVQALCECVLGRHLEIERFTYRDIVLECTGKDPVVDGRWRQIQNDRLDERSPDLNSPSAYCGNVIDNVIEEFSRNRRNFFVYRFPPAQACFAAIRDGNPPVANRFELYLEGMELANGYQELTDPVQQRARMLSGRNHFGPDGWKWGDADRRLLEALESGLPECSGVAVGFDRLVMLGLGKRRIEEVISFPTGRA